MIHHRTLWIGAFALCVAAFATADVVSAAAATKTNARDKAIGECIAETTSRVPNPYVITDLSRGDRNPSTEARNIFRDCMRRKGFRP